MTGDNRTHPETPEVAVPPARCPACGAQDIKTTSKIVAADSYWRCCTCGEVWNVSRHRAASRYIIERPFRR